MEGALLGFAEARHLLLDEFLVKRHYLIGQGFASLGQVEQVQAAVISVRTAHYETSTLHATYQATYVAFGHEEPLREGLLADARVLAEVGQHFELRACEVELPQLLIRAAFYLVERSHHV
jgi:hypothetical protein